MRTTISIEDSLLEQAKAMALKEKCSLGTVVEEALRVRLLSQHKGTDRPSFRPWVTYNGQGVQPGVVLNDSAALEEVMGDS
jgi:hypothetical protein